MIVIAGKNDIAVHGLFLAMDYFESDEIVVIVNRNDNGIDDWQRSLLKAATNMNITVKTLDQVYESKISYFFSLEFDQIIQPAKIGTDKIYNMHFSALPKYKGMYTSVWPILYGDEYSGVTIHEINSGIDTGNIVGQKIFKLSENDRSQDCYRKYIENSKLLLSSLFLKIIIEDIKTTKQTAIESTYFSKKSIDFYNLNINFNQTAWQIKRQIYAFSFRPYQLLKYKNKNISDVIIKDDRSVLKPGTLISSSTNYFTLSTIDYDIELYIDKLDNILEMIPLMSLDSFSRSIVNILGVNDKNSKGWSPIIVSAYHGRKEFIVFLLENGADINDRDYHGATVLMYAKEFAIRYENSDFFKFLIELGADINLKDWSGKSLLDHLTDKELKLLGFS